MAVDLRPGVWVIGVTPERLFLVGVVSIGKIVVCRALVKSVVTVKLFNNNVYDKIMKINDKGLPVSLP